MLNSLLDYIEKRDAELKLTPPYLRREVQSLRFLGGRGVTHEYLARYNFLANTQGMHNATNEMLRFLHFSRTTSRP